MDASEVKPKRKNKKHLPHHFLVFGFGKLNSVNSVPNSPKSFQFYYLLCFRIRKNPSPSLASPATSTKHVFFIPNHKHTISCPFHFSLSLSISFSHHSPAPHHHYIFSVTLFFTSSSVTASSMESQNSGLVFQDYFPTMVEKLGTEGFMKELRNGFRLLMDREKEVITFESLKKNSASLGMQGMSDDELMCMLREGDLDGDGALDEMEFCTLMFRLSPDLMNNSKNLLEEATFTQA